VIHLVEKVFQQDQNYLQDRAKILSQKCPLSRINWSIFKEVWIFCSPYSTILFVNNPVQKNTLYSVV
jgi:hypothetical protein